MKITHSDVEYFLPKGLSKRAKHRRIAETPEPELVAWVAQYLKEHSGSMIHAGAFSGDLLPQLCASATYVYAWEPVSYNCKAARRTLKHNNIINCKLRNAALSNTAGTIDIVTQFKGGYLLGGLCCVLDNNTVSSPLLAQAQDPLTETVDAVKIDDYSYLDLKIIHLDLEGWELSALKGAFRTIKEHRPIIIVEDTEYKTKDLLSNWNYKFIKSVGSDRVYIPSS